MSEEPSLAVLLTQEHAAEVRRCAEGQDFIDTFPEVHNAEPAAWAHGLAKGAHWERLRPLEAASAIPPQVPYSRTWYQARGRFCSLRGAGGAALHVLRGRRPF